MCVCTHAQSTVHYTRHNTGILYLNKSLLKYDIICHFELNTYKQPEHMTTKLPHDWCFVAHHNEPA